MKRSIGLIALSLWLHAGSAAAQTPLDAPVHVYAEAGGDVLHADIEVVFDARMQSASVREELRILLRPNTPLSLSMVTGDADLGWSLGPFEMDQRSVSAAYSGSEESPSTGVVAQLDSLGAVVDSLQWEAWTNDSTLRMRWSNLPPDTLVMRLEYSIERGQGLQTETWGVWTDTQPGLSWLILPDPATDPFSATLRLVHPDSWSAVAPGRLVAASPGQTDFALPATTVGERLPMAAGALSRHEAGRVSVFYPEGTPTTFLRHAGAIADRWHSRWPSLADSLQLVAVDLPGPELPFNPETLAKKGFRDIVRAGTSMGLMDRTMLADERTAAAINYDGLVAQVLAPLVNPVLVDQWTDIWVREAFTCALGSTAESSGGSRDTSFGTWIALADAYLDESEDYQRPLAWDRWREPSDLIDAHACGRGAWLLRYLSDETGSSVLDRLLRADMTTADSDGLFEALSSRSAASLEDIFDTMVHAAGHPVIEVSTEFAAIDGRLSISLLQTQEGALVPAVIPVQTGIRTSSIAGGSESFVRFREQQQTLTLDMDIPARIVQLDSAGVLLAQISYDWDAGGWSATLTEGSDWERYRAVRASGSFVGDPSAGFALRMALASEPLPTIRELIVRSVGELPGSSRLLETALRDPDARVRVAAVEMLAQLPGTETISQTLLGLASSDSVYAVQAAVVLALDALDSGQALSVARSALITPSQFEVVREAGFAVLARRADTQELAHAFLEYTSGNAGPDRIRAALAAASGLSGHRNAGRRVLSLLEHDLATVRLMAARAAGAVLIPDDEQRVRRLAGNEPLPNVRAELFRLAAVLADRR